MDGNYTLEVIKQTQLARKEMAIGVSTQYVCNTLDRPITVTLKSMKIGRKDEKVDIVVPINVAKYSKYLCDINAELDVGEAVPYVSPNFGDAHMISIINFYNENEGKITDKPILMAKIPTDEYFEKQFIKNIKDRPETEVKVIDSLFNIMLTADYFGFESYIGAAAHFIFKRSFYKSMPERKKYLENIFYILPLYSDQVNWVETLSDISHQLATILLQTLYGVTMENYKEVFKYVNPALLNGM